jgi:hypothetical protein
MSTVDDEHWFCSEIELESGSSLSTEGGGGGGEDNERLFTVGSIRVLVSIVEISVINASSTGCSTYKQKIIFIKYLI